MKPRCWPRCPVEFVAATKGLRGEQGQADRVGKKRPSRGALCVEENSIEQERRPWSVPREPIVEDSRVKMENSLGNQYPHYLQS
jgi:hypothetical protein